MTATSRLILKYVSRSRKAEGLNRRNWWNIPALAACIDRRICPEHETGALGAVRVAANGRPFPLAVSVGCGSGKKERRLLQAGVVERFELYEISPDQAERARELAREEGLSDRVKIRIRDVFKEPAKPKYDLVYWDHALHHMFDVEKALTWSMTVLKPGGLLFVNDYVGPNRLQWKRSEIDFARKFVERHAGVVDVRPTDLRYSSLLGRLRIMYRDPSEAPQSDRIMTAFERQTGQPMRAIGGAMIHLCGPFVTAVEEPSHRIFDDLIQWDDLALQRGLNHFAVGQWRKPM